MKILWLDINSSYSHSSVALPAIHAQVAGNDEWEWCVVRGTINDNPGALAAEVARQRPDVIAATLWLFTHHIQVEVLSRAVQLLDGTRVVCGGPEFLGDNEDFLKANPFVTAVIRGEGEYALPEFLSHVNEPLQWMGIQGLCWIDTQDGKYCDNGIARVQDFALLKYPEDSEFFNWDKPFVQLETTRGCFNTCAFCVSGGDKPVRYQSLEQVRTRLDNICSHGIKDIRVLDRTFNYDIDRACGMLDLFEQYAGRMRFHLEIHPSLLSERLKARIATLPKGLLHLEAGIQSLDSGVLADSGRKGSLKSSLEGLKYLCLLDNVQTHADLIAGLPGYSLEMLCKDIRTLVEIGADELQIESLKVLPGTRMRAMAQDLGLKYSPLSPYEVLQTPAISPAELFTAMQLSRTIDLYYNSHAWQSVSRGLISRDPEFLPSFAAYLKEMMVLDSSLSLERRGVILYEFCKLHYPDAVADVSIAWIRAGLSLKKPPAGNIMKIKHLQAFLDEEAQELCPLYGEQAPTHRYYLFTANGRRLLFGYDAETHQPSPVYCASLNISTD